METWSMCADDWKMLVRPSETLLMFFPSRPITIRRLSKPLISSRSEWATVNLVRFPPLFRPMSAPAPLPPPFRLARDGGVFDFLPPHLPLPLPLPLAQAFLPLPFSEN